MTAVYSSESRGKAPTLPGPLALAREGADGASWYADATASIERYAAEHGHSVATVADVLALTSPRQTVTRNVQLAHAYLSTGSTAGTLPSVAAALAHWESTGIIRGGKTGPFSLALQGDSNAVVVDVWMFRAFGLDWPSMTPKRYREAARRVRGIATRAGMTPRDCQAAVWVATRRRYGYTTNAPLVMAAL